MGLLNMLGLKKAEKRSSVSAHPRDPALAKWFSRGSSSGVTVDDDLALTIPTFYACVKVLSEDIAKLPINVYRGEGEGRVRVTDSPLDALLRRRPNRWQTPFEFKQQMMRHKLMRGNAYAEIITDRTTGQIGELIALNPDRVTPFRAQNGQRAYTYRMPSGQSRIILQDEMFHLMGLSDDGLVGRSVLDDAAQTLGLAYSISEYGAEFFANGAIPAGVLKHPQTLSDEANNRLKRDWDDNFRGRGRRHKMAVLEEGLSYETIQLNAEQTQFIESRKITPIEICQFFRMTPHKVGLLDKATFSNIEHQSLEHFTDALLSHMVAFEECANRDLLKTKKEQEYYFRFNPDVILRADIKSRYDAYRIACGRPWMTPNEVRAKEEENALQQDGMDDVMAPLNMDNPGGKPDVTKKD